jgi:hypothetical protein
MRTCERNVILTLIVLDLIYESVEVIAERFRKAEKMEKILAGTGTAVGIDTKKSA